MAKAGFPAHGLATDADGTFAIEAVEPGYWSVCVSQIGTDVWTSDFVEIRSDHNIDVDVAECGTVRGIVRGVPLGANPHVRVVAFDRLAHCVETAIAADGSFCLERVPLRPVYLKAGHDATADPARGDTELGSSLDEADPTPGSLIVNAERGVVTEVTLDYEPTLHVRHHVSK